MQEIGGPGRCYPRSCGWILSLVTHGLTTSDNPVRTGVHNPHHYPPMTIAYLWGQHPARQKKGVHLRPGAGRRPNDGRASSVEMHRGLGEPDAPSPNPCQSHSSHLLVAGPCTQGRSSASGWQGTCANPALRSPVHPSLLPDVGVDGDELLEQYAEVPADFRARVTVFGVQRSLSMLDLRLCFDDLGIWGFGVGMLCRNGSKLHIHLEHDTSSLLAVHGLSLIAAAMRRTYRWRCVLHTEGLPAFPRRATDPLPTPYPLRTPNSLPWRCLTLGTWNVEGLTGTRKQLEIGGVLRQARQHIVAVQESHESAASHIDVPGYRWFGNPRVGRRKGGVGFLVVNSLLPEIEECKGAAHPESLWLCVAGHRGERSLYVGCVYMPPVLAAEEERHYATLMEDILGFQEKGQVVVLGDLNARVGSAAANFDVIGRFGETHTNASGQRLIQLLRGTSMYALNGRLPCMQPA